MLQKEQRVQNVRKAMKRYGIRIHDIAHGLESPYHSVAGAIRNGSMSLDRLSKIEMLIADIIHERTKIAQAVREAV